MTDFNAHFTALYGANPDPWNYETSAYERAKYDATCAALTSPRYRSGLEVGCSIGVLSARLAARCDSFIAMDLAEAAVARAADRLSGFAHSTTLVGAVPEDWPDGRFDLIMLSEVIYYLTAAEIAAVARLTVETALPGAECVLVNWRGHTDTGFTGTAARHAFCAAVHELCNASVIHHSGSDDYDHVTLILPGPRGVAR
jgi:SAM-dependent methyltransferase